MKIAAIMPCRGRAEQTARNVKRLLDTAGYADWRLILAVDNDQAVWDCLGDQSFASDPRVELCGLWDPARLRMAGSPGYRLGYWKTLAAATQYLASVPDDAAGQDERVDRILKNKPLRAFAATHYVNLANDLIPGMHWLGRAVAGWGQAFQDDRGVLGFNGDSHEVAHSCHFLISRRLLGDFGGWPIWYDHNFGDTELCQRAIQRGVYAKLPWAILFHDHPYFGGDDDAVYATGRARAAQDEQLYQRRRALQWQAEITEAYATT
jgi:hypothetical protein